MYFTGQKPYACSVCGARFADSSSCRRHSREHEGYKPYNCSLCPETFKRAGQLKTHMAKKHSIGVSTATTTRTKTTNAITQNRDVQNVVVQQPDVGDGTMIPVSEGTGVTSPQCTGLAVEVQEQVIAQIQQQMEAGAMSPGGTVIGADGAPVQVAFQVSL